MTIFIAGVHGVGKSYLSEPVAARLGLKYARASQLIREELGRSSWTASKVVSGITQNQTALVTAVTRIRAAGQSLLLDGHLVLRTSVDQHQPLPVTVFRELGCDAVVLLSCPASVVLARLSARDDQSWTEPELISFALAEAGQAQVVCASLGIPLVELQSPTAGQFEDAISAQVRKR